MRDLRFVSLTEDRRRLVLAAPDGETFAVAVDQTLRDAVTGAGERRRRGKEQHADGVPAEPRVPEPAKDAPRPREIQARIRAGETAEQIAATAEVPVERVRRYEGPVLAEREHMVQAAQSAAVRRHGDQPAEHLGEVVAARLQAHGITAEALHWDSRRCEDQTWLIELRYQAGGTTKHASWVFDPQRRVVSAADDEARWLSDRKEQPAPARPHPFVPRLASAPGPHPVPPRELPGQGALDDDSTPAPLPEEDDEEHPRAPRHTERLVGATDGQAVRDGVAPGKRATVPTWDEIVFGVRRQD